LLFGAGTKSGEQGGTSARAGQPDQPRGQVVVIGAFSKRPLGSFEERAPVVAMHLPIRSGRPARHDDEQHREPDASSHP
jgi:hypothetical protein